jgi:hypothetical protein
VLTQLLVPAGTAPLADGNSGSDGVHDSKEGEEEEEGALRVCLVEKQPAEEGSEAELPFPVADFPAAVFFSATSPDPVVYNGPVSGVLARDCHKGTFGEPVGGVQTVIGCSGELGTCRGSTSL